MARIQRLSGELLLARMDERLISLQASVKPMVDQIPSLHEAVKWLKLAVLGIYTGVGVFLVQQALSGLFKK